MDQQSFDNVRNLSRSLVIEGLQREWFPRLTLDFDGSVQSTKGHAEGTAVGFNKVKKGRAQLLSVILHGGPNRPVFRCPSQARQCP
jgi:hypothetical protein